MSGSVPAMRSGQYYPFLPHEESKKKGVRNGIYNPSLAEMEGAAQKAAECISVFDPIQVGLSQSSGRPMGSVFTVAPDLFELLTQPLQLCAYYEEFIRSHVQLRVALFFQQAVACYNSPFHFEIPNTEGQYLQAKSLKCISGSKTVTVSFQAAHSSELPALKACLRSEYEAHLQGGPAPRYFTYLKGSSLNALNDSTMGLPTFVNQIDTLIDGSNQLRNGLRGPTIQLLNELAQKRITPTDATRRFLEAFDAMLVLRPRASQAMRTEKWRVIEIYQQEVAGLRVLAEVPDVTTGVHPLFDGLLDLNLYKERPEETPLLREIVFKRKYRLIKEAHLTEARIHDCIRQRFLIQSPDQLHTVRSVLIYSTSNNPKLCRSLQKLFCISLEKLKSDRNLVLGMERELKINHTVYSLLQRDIREAIRLYQRYEHGYQAVLIRDLRKQLRGMLQKDLVARYSEVIQNKVARAYQKGKWDKVAQLQNVAKSGNIISKFENNKFDSDKHYKTPENQRFKQVTILTGKLLAKALSVQPGHFFPSLFASNNEL